MGERGATDPRRRYSVPVGRQEEREKGDCCRQSLLPSPLPPSPSSTYEFERGGELVRERTQTRGETSPAAATGRRRRRKRKAA